MQHTLHIKEWLHHLPETHTYRSIDRTLHKKGFWAGVGFLAFIILVALFNLMYEGVSVEPEATESYRHFLNPL